jgi:hypothetical protein
MSDSSEKQTAMQGSASPPCSTARFVRDRPWNEYPSGTKAHAIDGGCWLRVQNGWMWHTGDTFPTPGADAMGKCVELP